MDWIDKCGNLFSFLGLILTILTFAGVIWNKRILKVLNKKNFKLNRMPENLSDLKEISNKISDLLAEFEQNKKELIHNTIDLQKNPSSFIENRFYYIHINIIDIKRP